MDDIELDNLDLSALRKEFDLNDKEVANIMDNLDVVTCFECESIISDADTTPAQICNDCLECFCTKCIFVQFKNSCICTRCLKK